MTTREMKPVGAGGLIVRKVTLDDLRIWKATEAIPVLVKAVTTQNVAAVTEPFCLDTGTGRRVFVLI